MKILLVAVNAKYIHSNLAVYTLKAYAGKYADQIKLVEMTINHGEEDILKEIYREKADVVAFSCYIWNISIIKRVTEELRKVQPEVKIWFGGPEVSYDAERSLQEVKQLDGVMIGEGEQTFLELMEYYIDTKNNLSEIAGLAFKDSAKVEGNANSKDKANSEDNSNAEDNKGDIDIITVTDVRQPLSMDRIPFPYKDLETFKNRIIYYESSRGCPFSCSYCLSSIDKRIRFRSPELVMGELKFFLELQVPQVKFVDRTFNCNKKHAMQIWQFIKENDNGITNFHFEISADLLEEDEIDFLATLRPGQIQLEIGVQSTNPETVTAIHRRMDFTKIADNVNRIRKGRNIHQHLDLIAGLPMEGYSSFEQSFQEVYRLKPDQLQLGFLKVLKGSLMEMDCKNYGINYRNTPPYEVLYTDALPYEDLLKIKGVCEMVEFYYNSGQFTYTLNFLEHYYTSPMELYHCLSDYYENTGISLMAHSRIKRYEILLDFFQKVVLESIMKEQRSNLTALFKELLLFDLFLREDMKTRPSFSSGTLKQSNLRLLYETYQTDSRQIHIEQFQFDVIASSESGTVVKKCTTILFDYSKRDPLNRAAEIRILE